MTTIRHAGIESCNKERDCAFYADNFGFHIDQVFALPQEIALPVFGCDGNVEVVRLSKDGFSIEMFITNIPAQDRFWHLCFEISSLKEQVATFERNRVVYHRIERPNRRYLLFVRDCSGNLIELCEPASCYRKGA
jgi:predicted enzyme related to lactoylglutathione lyase